MSSLPDGDYALTEFRKWATGRGTEATLEASDPGEQGTQAHNGSVRAITDFTGAVVAHYEYDAWGNQLGSSSPFSGGFAYGGFVGAFGVRLDGTTGLHYMRNRWYESGLGRFLSRDPMGLLDDSNLYAYVGNNPVNSTDSLGLQSWWQGTIRVYRAHWDASRGYVETLIGQVTKGNKKNKLCQLEKLMRLAAEQANPEGTNSRGMNVKSSSKQSSISLARNFDEFGRVRIDHAPPERGGWHAHSGTPGGDFTDSGRYGARGNAHFKPGVVIVASVQVSGAPPPQGVPASISNFASGLGKVMTGLSIASDLYNLAHGDRMGGADAEGNMVVRKWVGIEGQDGVGFIWTGFGGFFTGPKGEDLIIFRCDDTCSG